MNNWVEKFVYLEQSLSREKGRFALFALFLREDSIGKWDLLAAAPWIEANSKSALKDITNQIDKFLTQEEIISIISRVVIIPLNSPALKSINNFIHVEHGSIEIYDLNLFGLEIKHGYVITSQKQNAEIQTAI